MFFLVKGFFKFIGCCICNKQMVKDFVVTFQNLEDHMNLKCREYFVPNENISIDESTIGFKGRFLWKCYNPNKPTKWGLVCTLCVRAFLLVWWALFHTMASLPQTDWFNLICLSPAELYCNCATCYFLVSINQVITSSLTAFIQVPCCVKS